MVRTQISMTEEQAEGLRRLAALRQRSQAALLRDALDSLLAGNAHQRRTARARQAIGAFRSGHHDTSEHHDAAFADTVAR